MSTIMNGDTPAGRVRVAQCWDDGVVDDIRVIQILRKYGAKASFNLNIATHGDDRGEGWNYRDIKKVYKLSRPELVDTYSGFLVANHSATHPFLTRIPIEDAMRDIRDGRDGIEQVFGYPIVGFAYPYGDYNDAVKDAIRSAGHVYARVVANVDTVFPCADTMEFHPNCHFRAGDFWDRFERAAPSGVFYFWGHSFEIVTEDDWAAFDEQMDRLYADPRVEPVDLPSLFA